MHGQHCEERQKRWHMWPAPCQRPLLGTLADSTGVECFSKDGRKIGIGDCALFQAGNALPFIGIIRKLTTDKEGNLKLVVNWLYRPADVKLTKGVPFEAAPNEIFYSFHKDEIPSLSLLHPCKVAFLQKGVELSPGVSSFVCRRVYDTANRCLWWLTDRDYTDEHQEEVDQLLDKTKYEMQTALQTGGLSPKALIAASSQQPKANSEVSQNASLSTQGKGRKRERTDQSSDHSKRERLMKIEDNDSGHLKKEHSIKPEEIASIVDKDGGLVNLLGVDHLVHLMQQEWNNGVNKASNIVARRTMLAGIISATEKEECLNRFVQLGGLHMLNDWLQEAHRGKDGGSPREGDKGLEELLLALLQALDKLPVDLDALKTCIVGKSVNNLRSHKNMEIQKKSRKIVDTWKKRVDAEMQMSSELKAVANSASKQSSVDLVMAHSVKGGASSDAAQKAIPLVKSITNGTCPGDCVSKSVVKSEGGKLQCSNFNSKENHAKVHAGGITEVPLGSAKEEKSSSSSQSQNNSHSWSSGVVKGTGLTWKDEGKSSSIASVGTKSATTVPHNHSSGKGHSSCLIGSQETGGGKLPSWSRTVAEKAGGGLMERGSSESIRVANSNNQRIIVRLPNPGRSPACSASGGSVVDFPSASGSSSPNLCERHDVVEGKHRMQNATSHVGSPNDTKSGSCNKSGSGCGDDKERSYSTVPANCLGCRTSDFEQKDKMQAGDGKKGTVTSDILISADTCAVFSEAPKEDDTGEAGIDLLASVAASESSEGKKSALRLEECNDAAICDGDRGPENQARTLIEAEPLNRNCMPENLSGFQPEEDRRVRQGDTGINNRGSSGNCTLSEYESGGERTEAQKFSSQGTMELPEMSGNHMATLQVEETTDERYKKEPIECLLPPLDFSNQCATAEKETEGALPSEDGCDSVRGGHKETACEGRAMKMRSETNHCHDGTLKGECQDIVGVYTEHASLPGGSCEDVKEGATSPANSPRMSPLGTAPKVAEAASEYVEEDALEVAWQVAREVEQEVEQYGKTDRQDVNAVSVCKIERREPNTFDSSILQPVSETDGAVRVGDTDNEHLQDTLFSEDSQEAVTEKREDKLVERTPALGEGEEVDQGPGSEGSPDGTKVSFDSTVVTVDRQQEGVICVEKCSHSPQALMPQQSVKSTMCDRRAVEATEPEQAMMPLVPSDSFTSEASLRPVFDLNEGIAIEEHYQDDATTPTISSTNNAILVPGLSIAPAAPPNGIVVPIAVVAATKGPFILPSNPLQYKDEPGWKGSAAMSAFRPAEPLRTPDRHQSSVDVSAVDATIGSTDGKQPRFLDIDLNVPGERGMEDVGIMAEQSLQALGLNLHLHPSSVGGSSQAAKAFSNGAPSSGCPINITLTAPRPELDLNQVDQSGDMATSLLSELTVKERISLGISNSSSRVMRDFDLNDGPSLEDATGDEPISLQAGAKNFGNSMLSSFSGLRMNPEVVNMASWFPSGNSLPMLAMPGMSVARVEPPYPVAVASVKTLFSAGSGVNPFCGDLYRAGSVISSPSLSYSTTMPSAFPYAGFPIASNFPFSSASGTVSYLDLSTPAALPSVSSQLVSAGTVVSPYARPYLMGVSDISGAESSTSWSRRNLDLNAGPDPVDMDSREEGICTWQASGLSTKDSFQVGLSGVALKRKEPESGFDPFRPGFKQTWQ